MIWSLRWGGRRRKRLRYSKLGDDWGEGGDDEDEESTHVAQEVPGEEDGGDEPAPSIRPPHNATGRGVDRSIHQPTKTMITDYFGRVKRRRMEDLWNTTMGEDDRRRIWGEDFEDHKGNV